eukprot:g4179.t1
MPLQISKVSVHDVRFPTSDTLSGSDAVHPDPDYSCIYVVLETKGPTPYETGPSGFGLTFTLGRGNEIIVECCKSLVNATLMKEPFRSMDFEHMMETMMHFKGLTPGAEHHGIYYALTQEGQMRWLGPEKGVISMASGAILNAMWDLYARGVKGKPLWKVICDMSPEYLVKNVIDFRHIDDFITPEEALTFLKKAREGDSAKVPYEERLKLMQERGVRAYTTSCGWLGYSLPKVRALCKESLAEGHTYFKMKVGSPNIEEDIERAAVIRDEIGEDCHLMMDANQKWSVTESIINMEKLSKYRPLWIEEPTHADDVLGHAKIAEAISKFPNPVGVATGEVCANKVLFKQLLQSNAIKYCQIDSCRVASINEILSICLMSAKAGVRVCPHAGGVGLCEYVRHLSIIDYVLFDPLDDIHRVCESTTHCLEHFEDPVSFQRHDNPKGLFYKAPVNPGYSKMVNDSLKKFSYPNGSAWTKVTRAQTDSRFQGEQALNTMTTRYHLRDEVASSFSLESESATKNSTVPFHQQVRKMPSCDLSVPVMGMGCASLGDLFVRISTQQAIETIRKAYFDHGVRYFDTAPFYGVGLSEHRVGAALYGIPRDDFVISTKVGRVLVPIPEGFKQVNVKESWAGGRKDYKIVYDYTADGIEKSLSGSLQRLGLARVDALIVHDLEPPSLGGKEGAMEKMKELQGTGAFEGKGGFDQLKKMKAEGRIKAIGAGVNVTSTREWNIFYMKELIGMGIDFFLLAGAHTLLQDVAHEDGLLDLCAKNGVSLIIGGAFNSGILAVGSKSAEMHYNYDVAPPEIIAKVKKIEKICHNSGFGIQPAALRYGLSHPAVVSVIPGCKAPWELETCVQWMNTTVPETVWQDLRKEKVIP